MDDQPHEEIAQAHADSTTAGNDTDLDGTAGKTGRKPERVRERLWILIGRVDALLGISLGSVSIFNGLPEWLRIVFRVLSIILLLAALVPITRWLHKTIARRLLRFSAMAVAILIVLSAVGYLAFVPAKTGGSRAFVTAKTGGSKCSSSSMKRLTDLSPNFTVKSSWQPEEWPYGPPTTDEAGRGYVMDGAGEKLEKGNASSDAMKFSTPANSKGGGYVRLNVHLPGNPSITCFAADVALGIADASNKLGYTVGCSRIGQALDSKRTPYQQFGLSAVLHLVIPLSCADLQQLTVEVSHAAGDGSARAYFSNIQVGVPAAA
ncbi:hypothetical protein [Dactylosporangium sp. NPDC051541]|uniref:hypothetical protein n=1 Tax=Dactylosporangium sp. NPDC051541 TaxID=3363977 RepID=UPI0037A8702E